MMKKIASIILILLLITFTACSTEESTEETSEETATGEPPLGNEWEEDTNDGTEGEPFSADATSANNIQDQALGEHKTYFATSEDGDSWEVQEEAIAEQASVPDLILLEQDIGEFEADTLLMYYVDTSTADDEAGSENIALMYSTDKGETWSEKEFIAVEGAEDHVVVDPSLVQLEDGTLRLYYFDFSQGKDIASGEDISYTQYAAESSDGKTFTLKQAVLETDFGLTDPEVIFFKDQWFMYMATLEDFAASVAVSDDGLNFEYVENTGIKAVPGAFVAGDQVYLLGCDLGITRSVSDDGISFSDTEVIISRPGCDPSMVQFDDGSYAMTLRSI